MIIDLTRDRLLARLPGDYKRMPVDDMGESLLEDEWRHLLLADRDSGVSPVQQAYALLYQHVPRDVLPSETWTPILDKPVDAETWKARAAVALNEGLAYPSVEPTSNDESARARVRAYEALVIDPLLTLFSNPTCQSATDRERGGGYRVSEHTFDLFLLVYDARRLAAILVVDED